MLKQHITSKIVQAPVKAAAPSQGAAAFFYSTVLSLLARISPFPAISRQNAENDAIYNLLPKTHYFRPGLAEHPQALVIRIEGRKEVLFFREVPA